MKLRITRQDRWEHKIEQAKTAKRKFRSAIIQYSNSPNKTQQTYAELAEMLVGMLGSLEGGFAEGQRRRRGAAEKHLETVVQPTIDKGEVVSTARVEALKMFGYSDEELTELGDVAEFDMDRLQELINERTKKMLGLNGGMQKVVPAEELEGWIEQGWDYKRDLPNGKVVIGLRAG